MRLLWNDRKKAKNENAPKCQELKDKDDGENFH